MSSFQALATAIAAQVGTGIIVGGGARSSPAAGRGVLDGSSRFSAWPPSTRKRRLRRRPASSISTARSRAVLSTLQTAFKGKFGKFLAGFSPSPSLWRSASWLHGAVQLHRRNHGDRVWHPILDHRHRADRHLRLHLPRRRAAPCVRDGRVSSRSFGGGVPSSAVSSCSLPASSTSRRPLP